MRCLGWLLLLGVACSKANPAASCANGVCSDPMFAFCDVDGLFGGEPNTCVAITCSPGSIGGCRGSDELVCNAAGDSYDTRACSDGCTTPSGCNTPPPADCTANAVTCTPDGKNVQTCGADGKVASTEACALGCSDTGGSHCKQVVPSNNLQQFYDQTPNPTDLTITGGTLDVGTGKFTPTSGAATTIPSFKVPAPSGGAPITVFVGKKITLGELTITSAGNDQMNTNGGLGPAAAFLATDDLQIQGRIVLMTGAVDIVGCTGGLGAFTTVGNATYSPGAGGGGHATDGADGGNVPNSGIARGLHGTASGTDALVPLRGGCPARGTAFPPPGPLAGRGGGALQLVSLSSIEIASTIVADGLVTQLNTNDPFGGTIFGGGGAGGGILIEAPQVTIGVGGKLLARGGGGNSGDFQTIEAQEGSAPIPGGVTKENDGTRPSGGAGGTDTVAPAAGGNTNPAVAGESAIRIAGGGGGGVGRIRINTTDGTFAKQASSVLAGRITTGNVTTK